MKPDIMNLQEARIVENNNLVLVDSLSPLYTFLTENGYTVLLSTYSKSNVSGFQYITVFKSNKFECQDQQV